MEHHPPKVHKPFFMTAEQVSAQQHLLLPLAYRKILEKAIENGKLLKNFPLKSFLNFERKK